MTYLVHHGILGQKWGVRRYQNEDGTLTAEGKKRRGELIKVVRAYDTSKQEKYDVGAKIRSNLRENEYVKEILNEIANIKSEEKNYDKEVEKIFKDYISNEQYYWALSGAAKALTYSSDMMGDIARSIQFNGYDDGDQGYMNSYAVYATEKNIVDQCRNFSKKYADVDRKVEESVTDLVGSFGKENLLINTQPLYKKRVDSMIRDMSLYVNLDNNEYLVDYANESKDISETDKQNITIAKSIISKAAYKDNNNYWWNLPKAIDNLNLTYKSYDELSDSDWKKINEECYALNSK